MPIPSLKFSTNADADQVEYFNGIYTAYWQKIYNYCYHHLKDSDSSKEIVQDIFFSLWERRYSLRIEGSEENYLIKAAKYKVFDFYRNQVNSPPMVELAEQTSSEEATENVVMYNGLVEKLNGLVGDLPEQCRRVFELSRQQGLSNKQIASDLLITEKTVEYHISKALKYLRDRLPEYSF